MKVGWPAFCSRSRHWGENVHGGTNERENTVLLFILGAACLLFGSAAWGQANQVKFKNGGRGVFNCDDENNWLCFDLAGGKEEGAGACRCQPGVNLIPGSTEHFGGNATTGFGRLAFVPFQNLDGSLIVTNDNRRVLDNIPCSTKLKDQLEDVVEKVVPFEK